MVVLSASVAGALVAIQANAGEAGPTTAVAQMGLDRVHRDALPVLSPLSFLPKVVSVGEFQCCRGFMDGVAPGISISSNGGPLFMVDVARVEGFLEGVLVSSFRTPLVT